MQQERPVFFEKQPEWPDMTSELKTSARDLSIEKSHLRKNYNSMTMPAIIKIVASKYGVRVKEDPHLGDDGNYVSYDTADKCIHVIDEPSSSYLARTKNDKQEAAAKGAIESLLTNYGPSCVNGESSDYMFLIFTALHECGHALDPSLQDESAITAKMEYMDEVRRTVQHRSDAGDYDSGDAMLLDFQQLSRKDDRERNADEFALAHLSEWM